MFWARFRWKVKDIFFLFKVIFQFDQYLNIITNFDKIRSLTKFRISSHIPKIERGRFSQPPAPLEKRIGDYCLLELEDEIRFLIKCPVYAHIRNRFFSLVQKHCKTLFCLMITRNLIVFFFIKH